MESWVGYTPPLWIIIGLVTCQPHALFFCARQEKIEGNGRCKGWRDESSERMAPLASLCGSG